MTDTMAARLMAKMRGTAEPETSEPKGDATALEIQRRMRGDTTEHREMVSDLHKANAQGEKEYRAALQKRVRELRSAGVQYPEITARTQLQRESQARSEAEQRRTVHEHAAAVSRDASQAAVWESRAAKPVVPRGEIPAGTSVNDHTYLANRDRVSERLMAQRYRANGN
ncbi:hypothetical protein OHB31_18730 [Streptomyces microflavus]|uniref:hypothetical protein n=1 Tax=Streptomyces microflavus TaxID=1919 RepID=UPI002DDA80CF|nr:hypothetical protein [Streptomyces microflavus]WSA62070.1 hypothetical protein OHB31_18730 [Streptomyces microflavus]